MMWREATFQLAAPADCGDPFAWVVSDLAAKAAISDVRALRAVLIKALLEAQNYAEGGGLVRVDDQISVASGHTARRARKINDLTTDLETELSSVEWPLEGAAAEDLRRALHVYRQHLASLQWRTKTTREANKPRAPETILTLVLAHYWEQLTGETPKAWRGHGQTVGEGGFNHFVGLACEAFGMKAPKSDTIRSVLRHAGHLPGKAD